MEEVMSIHHSKKDQNKDEAALITRDEVDTIIRETGFTKFGEIQNLVSLKIGGPIGYKDRKVISDSLRAAFCVAAEVKRMEADTGSRGILLFTAYTEDYTIGKLCDTVNRKYAEKYNYKYVSKVLTYAEMLGEIGPNKTHCTWYKALMINKFLNEETEMLERENIQYLMWIDADAVVINDRVKIEDIIARGRDRDLIIAENMHAGCLINAGVMLIRVSEWSRTLWQEVWDCNKYDDVTFYEQSALIRRLRAKREGLEMLEEQECFHSYLPGGPKNVKIFAHVAVLPHMELNTNSGWLCEGRQIERSRGRRLQKALLRLKRQERALEEKEKEVEKIMTEGKGLERLCQGEGEGGAEENEGGEEDEGGEEGGSRGDRVDAGGRKGVRGGAREGGKGGVTGSVSVSQYISDSGEHYLSERAFYESEKQIYSSYLKGEELPFFIFHAAGHCGKLVSLRGVLLKCGIEVEEEFLMLEGFSLPKGIRTLDPDYEGKEREGKNRDRSRNGGENKSELSDEEIEF